MKNFNHFILEGEYKDGEVKVGVDGWKRGGGCMDKDGKGRDY